VQATGNCMRCLVSHTKRALTGLEEKDGHLPQVEVDKVFGLVCDIRAKVAAHDAMPGRVVLLVKLLLDVSCNILLDIVFLHSLRCAIDGILLHVLCTHEPNPRNVDQMLCSYFQNDGRHSKRRTELVLTPAAAHRIDDRQMCMEKVIHARSLILYTPGP